MALTEPQADRVLLVVSLNPEAGYEDMFNHWYNIEHLPEVLACPGFEAGRRYELISGEGHAVKYLATYDVANIAAFKSKEYLRMKARTPDMLSVLGREMVMHRTTNFIGRYREIARRGMG